MSQSISCVRELRIETLLAFMPMMTPQQAQDAVDELWPTEAFGFDRALARDLHLDRTQQ